MESVVCAKCGESKFFEDEGVQFCSNCGYLDKVTSNVSLSQSTVNAISSASVQTKSKKTKKSVAESEEAGLLDILNQLMKSLASTLSELLNCPELRDDIGRRWIIYVYQIFDKKIQISKKGHYYFKQTLLLPSKIILIRMCFICIKLRRLNFSFADLKKLILESKLNYYTWNELVKPFKVPLFIEKLIGSRPLHWGDKFYAKIIKLGTNTLHDVPKIINYDIFLKRYTKELHFSDHIEKIALVLQTIFLENSKTFMTSKFPSSYMYLWPELYAMALIVHAARIYFSVGWVEITETLSAKSEQFVTNIREEFSVWLNDISMYEIIEDELIAKSYTNIKLDLIDKYFDPNIMKYFGPMFQSTYPRVNEMPFDLLRLQKIMNTLPEFFNTENSEIDSSDKKILKENCKPKNSLIDFANIDETLQNIIYQLPCVLIDSSPQLNLILEMASLKMAVSRRFFIQIVSDVQYTLYKLKIKKFTKKYTKKNM